MKKKAVIVSIILSIFVSSLFAVTTSERFLSGIVTETVQVGKFETERPAWWWAIITGAYYAYRAYSNSRYDTESKNLALNKEYLKNLDIWSSIAIKANENSALMAEKLFSLSVNTVGSYYSIMEMTKNAGIQFDKELVQSTLWKGIEFFMGNMIKLDISKDDVYKPRYL